MKDTDCVTFLRWALPRLQLDWRGFRRVRGQVCKRLRRRLRSLGLESLGDYRRYLQTTPSEWQVLDEACRITISRFYRDRGVFDFIGATVLPALARSAVTAGRDRLEIWSAGCASGEEPYSIALVWALRVAKRFPSLDLSIIATDADPALLHRAREAVYPRSAVKDLPPAWQTSALEQGDDTVRLREAYRRMVRFDRQDIRAEMPDGPVDLILCRNLVFTYFAPPLQTEMLAQMVERLRTGGALVIGSHEQLPAAPENLVPWSTPCGVYRKRGAD